MSIHTESIKFPGSQGHMLAAKIDWPEAKPSCFAIFAHCFTCSKDVIATSRISTELARLGVAVLRFDFTGLGGSEGNFADTNFTSNVKDIVAAATWLRERGQTPQLLIGHSLGGAAVIAAAKHVPEVQAVATVAAPYEPGHVTHHFIGSQDEICRLGEAEVNLMGRKFTIRKDFIDDITGYRLDDDLQNLHKALLVFHSPSDNVVGIENAGKIFAAAKHPKSFISLDDTDHLVTNKADAMYVAQVLAAWVSHYIAA